MPRPALIERLARAQAERAERALLRQLRTIDYVDGPWLIVEGKRLMSFASNDYLGLAAHPALRDALTLSARRHGVGASAAHLLGGHRRSHEALELALAEWTGRPAALLFSTGYMANLGVIAALLEADDVCVQDKLNHASLLDGARLAGCALKRYVHNDVDSARRQLRALPDAGALLATDGVFSMDGDLAPLAALAKLAKEEGAAFMVDDAHGLGVAGPQGRGSTVAAGLGEREVPIYMATLGKALGCFGAFIAGSRALIEGLVQFARAHVFTTAMPMAIADAARVAVDIARHEDWRRDKLRVLIRHFRHGAQARGLTLADSPTAIQPVLVGDSAMALNLSRALEAEGFHVPAIRPPTVPEGGARLRVSLSALHRESDLEQLLDALARAHKDLHHARGTSPRTPARHAQRAPRARRVRAR